MSFTSGSYNGEDSLCSGKYIMTLVSLRSFLSQALNSTSRARAHLTDETKWHGTWICPYISRRFFSLTVAITSCVYIPVVSDIPTRCADDVRCNDWTPPPDSSPLPRCLVSAWSWCRLALSFSWSFLLCRCFPGFALLSCRAKPQQPGERRHFMSPVGWAIIRQPLQRPLWARFLWGATGLLSRSRWWALIMRYTRFALTTGRPSRSDARRSSAHTRR